MLNTVQKSQPAYHFLKYFVSKEPDLLVTLKVALSNSSPKVSEGLSKFSLSIGWFFTHVQELCAFRALEIGVTLG